MRTDKRVFIFRWVVFGETVGFWNFPEAVKGCAGGSVVDPLYFTTFQQSVALWLAMV